LLIAQSFISLKYSAGLTCCYESFVNNKKMYYIRLYKVGIIWTLHNRNDICIRSQFDTRLT